MSTELKPVTKREQPRFDTFVCIGDSVIIESEKYPGLSWRVTVHQDTDCRPTDFDCYSTEHIAAFNRGDWFFCGLVVDVYLGDFLIESHCESLWGIDCNFCGGDNKYLDIVARDLISKAEQRIGPTLWALRNAIDETGALA